MSIVGSIAASGMAAATARLQLSAKNIATAATSHPHPGPGLATGADADLAGEIIQQLIARVNFAANVQVMKADAQMIRALIDIVA
jgi:flagellar basal body rod protein FlgC